jgi:hypothetical protein
MLTLMQISIDLPSELLREARRLAREEGSTMRALLEERLREVLARHRRQAGGFVLRDASVPGDGLSAEFADSGWAQIRETGYGAG